MKSRTTFQSYGIAGKKIENSKERLLNFCGNEKGHYRVKDY